MNTKKEMTRQEMIDEIARLFEQLTPENKDTVLKAMKATKSKSLSDAPDSFKDFLRLPENKAFAETFH